MVFFPQTQKPKLVKPAWAKKPTGDDLSARSDGPHNIFRPMSGRSSRTEDLDKDDTMENLDNSLSQSINKLQSLQKQFSSVNKQSTNNNNDDDADNGNNSALNSYRSVSTVSSVKTLTPKNSTARSPRGGSLDDFIQDVLEQTSSDIQTPIDTTAITNVTNITPESPTFTPGREGNLPLANNVVSRLGPSKKKKTSLSSIENSYQNIKPKTPVNQVKSSHRPFSAVSGSDATKGSDVAKRAASNDVLAGRKTMGQSIVEDYISTMNEAARKIQIWFRRHWKRRKVGEAAMRRLLGQKKEDHQVKLQMETQMSLTATEMEKKKEMERKKTREEKAREERQRAIKV